jgi:hypothetical protein
MNEQGAETRKRKETMSQLTKVLNDMKGGRGIGHLFYILDYSIIKALCAKRRCG